MIFLVSCLSSVAVSSSCTRDEVSLFKLFRFDMTKTQNNYWEDHIVRKIDGVIADAKKKKDIHTNTSLSSTFPWRM